MRKILALVFSVALSIFTSLANASVVTPGSTYGFLLGGEPLGSEPFVFNTAVFDGLTDPYAYGSGSISVGESETSLSGGRTLISFNFVGRSDIFPVAGGGLIGLGIDDPIDLIGSLFLEDARIIFRDISQTELFRSNNLADDFRAQIPFAWDGYFFQQNRLFVVGNAGAAGITEATLEFTVVERSAVPEPASMALLGVALLGLVVTRRKRV